MFILKRLIGFFSQLQEGSVHFERMHYTVVFSNVKLHMLFSHHTYHLPNPFHSELPLMFASHELHPNGTCACVPAR